MLSIDEVNKLREENTLLKDELYRTSEVEQCVHDLIEKTQNLKRYS